MKTFPGLLFAWLGFSSLTSALDDASALEIPCRARAWVRAPDLGPGRVIQGDVKVKFDGSCDEVSSGSLGLRFAERSWVKTRREDAKLPQLQTEPGNYNGMSSDGSVYEPDWFRHWSMPGVNGSVLEKYERDMKDPALWLVREEERIGFETKHILREVNTLSHNVVESFAILVPSTNYPPAFSSSSFQSGGETDAADSEHIYEYFVDVTFKNGTQRQIPAGYTSFDAVTKMEPPVPETINVTATRWPTCIDGCNETEDLISRDKFTLEVTFPNGRHFEQGSRNNISIVSHQLGPGLQRPFSVYNLNTHISQKRLWAAKLAADSQGAKRLLHTGSTHGSQLWPEIDDNTFSRHHEYDRWDDTALTNPQFSQDGVIESGTAFSTGPVTGQFGVSWDCYPPFEMYYQTSEVQLHFVLQVQNISSADPLPTDTTVDEDEYDWTPELRQTEVYRGSDYMDANIPIFVHRKPEDRATWATRETVHYLSSGARSPVFVDPASLADLAQKTVQERDGLAPIAQPRFVKSADGNVVKRRYSGSDTWRGARSGPYYVGNTWLRKVVNKENGREAAAQGGGLVIQA